MSYILCAVMAPLLPHRLAAVSGGTASGGVAALWMVARFATLLAMWRTGFWHGRWGTLALAVGALRAGLAAVMLAPSLGVLAAGLVVFGVGMGLTYYAALYYSLAVGHAAVDAGGTFEALIGFGYFGGPLLGLTARAVVAPAHAATATVALAWLVVAGCSAGALGRYLAARRARARLREASAAEKQSQRLRARPRASAARSSAAMSRMPSWLDPIVSGASVRSRKRARSPSSTSANRIAGSVTPPRAAGAGSGCPASRTGAAAVSSSRSAGAGAALVDQPVGRACGESPGRAAARPRRPRRARGLGEVARRDEHEVVAQKTGEAIEVLAAVLAHDEAG